MDRTRRMIFPPATAVTEMGQACGPQRTASTITASVRSRAIALCDCDGEMHVVVDEPIHKGNAVRTRATARGFEGRPLARSQFCHIGYLVSGELNCQSEVGQQAFFPLRERRFPELAVGCCYGRGVRRKLVCRGYS